LINNHQFHRMLLQIFFNRSMYVIGSM
jgi:hypothetical protein